MVKSTIDGWHKSRKPMVSSGDRYGVNWNRAFLAKAHATTNGVCCYCGKAHSKEIHHVHYRRLPVWVSGAVGAWFSWFVVVVCLQQPILLLPWLLCSPIVLWPATRITDREIVGWDVFPVCGSQNEQGSCHWRLHLGTHWVRDKSDPTWGNHNTWFAVWRLRLGWWVLRRGRSNKNY